MSTQYEWETHKEGLSPWISTDENFQLHNGPSLWPPGLTVLRRFFGNLRQNRCGLTVWTWLLRFTAVA